MTLSTEDFSAILKILEEIYQLRDLDSFTETTMRLLPPLVESNLAALNEVNYEARRMQCILDSPEAQGIYDENQPHFEALMHENPLIAHYAEVRDEPKKVSDFLNDQEWQQTLIYRNFYAQIQGNYQIALVLPLKSETMVAYAFNRAASDFTERHRSLLAALQPHLTRAYENAVIYSQTVRRMEAREDMLAARGAGWLDLDATLKIQRVAPQVLNSIASFFPSNPPGPDRLPGELERWIREQLARSQADQGITPWVITQENSRLILRLFRGTRSGDVSLATEVYQLAVDPETLKDLGMSRRQTEILYWVSQGKSNTEIAVILKLSLSTVENHVYRLLKSLKLKNRTEAAQLAQAHMAQSYRTKPRHHDDG
ncbi:MAG: LuxR C-terminal-related transcriptional regulator [Pseudomonadota bacterium]